MLKTKLIQVSDVLRQTGVFGYVFPLVRIVSTIAHGGVRSFPAAYHVDGELRHVLHDNLQGVVYFRVSGRVAPATRRIQLTACSNDITELIYPVRQVVCVRKDTLSCETEEEVMMWTIAKTVSPDMIFQWADLDAISVLSQEYSAFHDFVDINYNYAYIAIEWIVYISANVCVCGQ